MQFKNDKRSLKTRKAIKYAFLKLLKTHEVSEINITEIATIAGINRNSFYTHYKSIGNILDDINNEIYSYIEEVLVKFTYEKMALDPYPIICEFSRVVINNKYITEYLLFAKSSTALVRKLKDSICDRFNESYVNDTQDNSPYVKYISSFVISGVFEMYHVWFRNGKDLPLDDISKLVSRIILSGISSLN